MRSIVIGILAAVVFALAASPVSAKTFKIVFKTEASLYASCRANGGSFASSSSGYGCAKTCGSGTCSVDCDRASKTCTGTTPRRVQDMQVITGILSGGSVASVPAGPSKPIGAFGSGILDNGPTFHSQGPAATGSPAAPAAPPSAPPIVIR